MDFNQLKSFMTIARTGNISKAAQELYVSQPSLSKSIARLEEELQVPLFRHRKGKIELNEYGSVFLSSVNIAFSQLSSGVQTIQRMYEMDQHILSLGCNISSYLPNVLPAFVSAHPEIGIRQKDCSTQQMVEMLLDRTLTLGISCEEIRHDSISFQKLGSKEYVLAVHRDNPIADGESVDVERLKDEVFICDASRFRIKPLQKLCQKYGFLPKVGFEIENSELLFQLVESNRGIAILPIGLCCELLRSHPENHVRLVRINAELPPIVIGIATHKGYEYSQAATIFAGYLMDQLNREEELIREMGYAFLDSSE